MRGAYQRRNPLPVNSAQAKLFVVLCERQDGREREFQRYATEAEASAVAARLVFVGCPSRVQRVEDVAPQIGNAFPK